MDSKLPLSTTLRDARTAQKLTREELAELVGVSAKSIQRYEEGKQIPRLRTLKKIGHLLGVSMVRLLVEDDQEPVDGLGTTITMDDLARMLRLVLARLDTLTETVNGLIRSG